MFALGLKARMYSLVLSCAMCLRFTFDVTTVDLLGTSMAAEPFQSTYLYMGTSIGGLKCGPFRRALINTVRKGSCGKVMFLHLSVSHSVHMGCISACIEADTPQTEPPPWADRPPFPWQTDTRRADTLLPCVCWDTHPLSSAC